MNMGMTLSLINSLSDKIAKKYSGASFVGMTKKGQDDVNKTITYTVTFLKSGVENKTDIVFNQPKDGISIISAEKENNNLKFGLSDGKSIILTNFYVDMKGEQGIQGIQGMQGVQGERGLQGEQGIKGDKGDKPNHEWLDTKLRLENPNGSWGNFTDLKGEKGLSAYQLYVIEATIDGKTPLSETQWLESLKGNGFKMRDKYEPSVAYHELEVVSYDNKTWCTSFLDKDKPLGITNITPSASATEWMLLLTAQVDTSNVFR